MLDHVLYPWNRLLGRKKADGLFTALVTQARGNFARALVADTRLRAVSEPAILWVFQEWLGTVDSIRRRAGRDWRDNRLVWLPLQLALRPDQHDTQEELDAIVEAAVGQRFTDGNRIWYVVNEEFRAEVTRTIREARSYHVLWIHDFRGRNDEGQPDKLALRYVVDAYLGALTDAVRAYLALGETLTAEGSSDKAVAVYRRVLEIDENNAKAHEALDAGKKLRLDPLNPYERRVVHLALKEIPGIRTYSIGRGCAGSCRAGLACPGPDEVNI